MIGTIIIISSDWEGKKKKGRGGGAAPKERLLPDPAFVHQSETGLTEGSQLEAQPDTISSTIVEVPVWDKENVKNGNWKVKLLFQNIVSSRWIVELIYQRQILR